jgi:DNA mismatch endonuclease (patch repair protein)
MAAPKILPRSKRQPLTRSQIMARIRSKNTRPEILTRAAVHALGLRFRKHLADLPGKPDLANKTRKWAIFIHGCFWHSHEGCRLASQPRSNASYWAPKLRRNIEHDCQKVRELQCRGYDVFIIWECQTRNPTDLQSVVTALAKSLVKR